MTTRAFVNALLVPPKTPAAANVVYIKTVSPLLTDYTTVGVPEAPNDGKTYGRQNLAWKDVTGGAGLPEAPLDAKAYLRSNGAWTSGGTLSSTLVLNADPASPLGAATKQYVDGKAAACLPLAGGTMGGNLILNADPTNVLGAATKQYVDNIVASLDCGTY